MQTTAKIGDGLTVTVTYRCEPAQAAITHGPTEVRQEGIAALIVVEDVTREGISIYDALSFDCVVDITKQTEECHNTFYRRMIDKGETKKEARHIEQIELYPDGVSHDESRQDVKYAVSNDGTGINIVSISTNGRSILHNLTEKEVFKILGFCWFHETSKENQK